MSKDELNLKIENPFSNINSLKGFEIVIENFVESISKLFGKNALLTISYQIGRNTGNILSERLKKKYGKNQFGVLEALEVLMKELNLFFSVQVKEMEHGDGYLKLIVENHCFLREPIKHRPKLKFGHTICRLNKGYFETAFKELLGDRLKSVEISYLDNDSTKNVCIEQLMFHFNVE